jgi:hypothetical protein
MMWERLDPATRQALRQKLGMMIRQAMTPQLPNDTNREEDHE